MTSFANNFGDPQLSNIQVPLRAQVGLNKNLKLRTQCLFTRKMK